MLETLPTISGQVLLVGWDAADWKIILPMIDRGEMPHLESLINRGVMGDLLTLRPMLSPMLWNSIATGHRSQKHGIHGFTEVDESTNTVRSVCSTSRRCKAIWNIVTQAGGRAHAVNWYASYPAEPINGICVSDSISRRLDGSPMPQGSIHPEGLYEEFADLRMRPEEIDVEAIRLFVPNFAEIDQENDKTLARLAKLLAESFTVHNAATRVLEDRPWNLAAVYYPGLDHFSHGFMNFHPPQMASVTDEEFNLYSQVVTGAYRLHDLFLGRLIELAGSKTSIVLLSDHGFHSDHLRPKQIPSEPVGPAVQHRQHGVLVMAGDGIKHDEIIYGANLLDIAPTVLTLLGLPIGADMPGRVLTAAFVAEPHFDRIESWEKLPGFDGRHEAGFVAPSFDQSMVLEQFAALGYVDLDEVQGSRGPDACRRENSWSLAQSLLQEGNVEQAVEILTNLCQSWPDRGDFAIQLAEALRRLGRPEECRRIVEAIVAAEPNSAPAHYLLGVVCLEEKRYLDAIQHLTAVGQEYADRADLHTRVGRAFLRLGRHKRAQAAFTRATHVDPHHPVPWLGLARCAMRKCDWEAAERLALHSLGLDFHQPNAHALLGLARVRLGRLEDAEMALKVACHQAPRWSYPRRLLALLGKDNQFTGSNAKVSLPTLKRKSVKGIRDSIEQLAVAYETHATVQCETSDEENGGSLELVIVSGLPRSGTSLMMQMLRAGGLPILTDGLRKSDDDNPAGYLEWEEIKNLPSRPDILRQAAGKAVKIVSPLLAHLPRKHKYKVLFADRPIREVLESQAKMRVRRGSADLPDPERLRAAMIAHRDATLALLKRSANVELLVVPYPRLIEDPTPWTDRIAAFLGEYIACPDKMPQVIKPELYRNRNTHSFVPSQTTEISS